MSMSTQLVRDEKGKKMSKSIGNVLDPLELVDEYGADALRFTLTSMAAMGRDLKLSKDRIQGYRNFGTKLWNAARFAEMNDCKPVDGLRSGRSVTQTVNKWIVGETARARMAHDEALSQATGSTTPRTGFTPSSGTRSATGTWNSPSRFSPAATRP
jgi:valyl-tRNA synthetase